MITLRIINELKKLKAFKNGRQTGWEIDRARALGANLNFLKFHAKLACSTLSVIAGDDWNVIFPFLSQTSKIARPSPLTESLEPAGAKINYMETDICLQSNLIDH